MRIDFISSTTLTAFFLEVSRKFCNFAASIKTITTMKKIFLLLVAVLLMGGTVLVLGSCSSDKDGELQSPRQEETGQGMLTDTKLGDVSNSGCLGTRADGGETWKPSF